MRHSPLTNDQLQAAIDTILEYGNGQTRDHLTALLAEQMSRLPSTLVEDPYEYVLTATHNDRPGHVSKSVHDRTDWTMSSVTLAYTERCASGTELNYGIYQRRRDDSGAWSWLRSAKSGLPREVDSIE